MCSKAGVDPRIFGGELKYACGMYSARTVHEYFWSTLYGPRSKLILHTIKTTLRVQIFVCRITITVMQKANEGSISGVRLTPWLKKAQTTKIVKIL